jgi:hypothetical protein
MSSSPGTETAPPRSRRRGLSWARFLLAALLGAGLTGLVIVVLIAARHGRLRPLTAETLDQARRAWDAQGPENYNIEIAVSGRQAAVYRVEVRQRQPLRATRNAAPLNQRRTWTTWSVPGMFGTLQADVDNLRRLAAGEQDLPALFVRVEFDPHFGFPKRYVRTEGVRMGTNPEVTWEVKSFEVVAAENVQAR